MLESQGTGMTRIAKPIIGLYNSPNHRRVSLQKFTLTAAPEGLVMSRVPAVRALVIGGGVVGCAVLYELARHNIDALLIEAELDVGEGTSKANSAIVHTGFDAKPGTYEAALLRRAAALWPAVIEGLAVPFLAVGALMLARTSEERDRLAGPVTANAAAQGIETELLPRDALRLEAPYLADDTLAALSIPGEGVIDPFWLTRAYAEAAVAGGAELLLGRSVVGLDLTGDRVVARLDDGTEIVAEQAFNCAGLFSDMIACLGQDDSFSITPRKGQFLVSEEPFGVDRIVLPLPGPSGKGMLVTPIVFGGVLLGPTAEDQVEKSDRSVTIDARAQILTACQAMVPSVGQMVPIRQFAGVRAVSSTGDYILQPARGSDRLFHVAGIRSTGISASPAIAERVVAWAMKQRDWPASRGRAIAAPVVDSLSEETGEVVCLCRSIGKAEVLAACHRSVGAATLDALKRRCGITFGDCQGNLCATGATEIAAAAWNRPVETVLKHRAGSWLFARIGGDTSPTASRAVRTRPVLPEQRRGLVIVGGGLAGIGTALAASRDGLKPFLVERELTPGGALRACLAEFGTEMEQRALAAVNAAVDEGRVDLWCGATAVGFLPDADGWRVLVQDGIGMAEIGAERLVLATGGYIQPREHLPIAGPRGSGIVTADFVHAALNRGLLPGTRAAIVGSGRAARSTAARLHSVGVEVRAELDWQAGMLPVDAVRGDRRLEAVRVNDRWLEVDTLVLAHRLLPATFLLRGLGLVDGRPDQRAPVGADSATPLSGLWAIGTCARPDVDHIESVSAGMALGTHLATTRITAP
jgi:glycerol-3-phosphate dehydrogenase